MSLAWLVAAVLVVPAVWVAALAYAVKAVSHSSLSARLAGGPRSGLAAWFVENEDAANIALSFVRTVLRIVIVVAIVVATSGSVATPEPAGVAAGDVTPAAEVEADPAVEAPAESTSPVSGRQVTPRSLLVAAVVSIGVIWLLTIVTASAIGRAAGEPLVAASLHLIRVIARGLAPLRPVVHVTEESVRRLAGADRREVEEEAEAQLLRSIEEQQRGGGLDPRSASMLENIVLFTQTDVGEVMTPRTDIDGIEYTDDIAEIRALIDEHGHSRMPVYEENLDHILGILYVKDLVPYLGAVPADFRLRPLLREPKFVPETKQVNELLQDFQRSEVHMSIVVDEYGGTAGVVTIEDVLEEIVGEIQDEHDTDHEDLPTLDSVEDGLVEVDGRYHIHDLNEATGLSLPDDEEYDTVAGFVLAQLGRVPAVGEYIVVERARVTVIESTTTVIERLRIEYGERARAEDDRATPTVGDPAGDAASESDSTSSAPSASAAGSPEPSDAGTAGSP